MSRLHVSLRSRAAVVPDVVRNFLSMLEWDVGLVKSPGDNEFGKGEYSYLFP